MQPFLPFLQYIVLFGFCFIYFFLAQALEMFALTCTDLICQLFRQPLVECSCRNQNYLGHNSPVNLQWKQLDLQAE